MRKVIRYELGTVDNTGVSAVAERVPAQLELTFADEYSGARVTLTFSGAVSFPAFVENLRRIVEDIAATPDK